MQVNSGKMRHCWLNFIIYISLQDISLCFTNSPTRMVFQVERTMTREVKMVAWSPTMDLLAIGTTCGKVRIQRGLDLT